MHSQAAASVRAGDAQVPEATSARTAQLLDQVREAQVNPRAAITAYMQLRNAQQPVVPTLSDVKLERFCEAIVAEQDVEAAKTIVRDLCSAAKDPETPDSAPRRLIALQILLGKGFLPGGEHILDQAEIELAIGAARQALGPDRTFEAGNQLSSTVFRWANFEHVGAYLRGIANHTRISHVPKSFVRLLLEHLHGFPDEATREPTGLPGGLSPATIAMLAKKLVFEDGAEVPDLKLCTIIVSLLRDSVLNERTSAGGHVSSTGNSAVRLASQLSRRWGIWSKGDPVLTSHLPLVELAALCVRTFTDRGRFPSVPVIVSMLRSRLEVVSAQRRAGRNDPQNDQPDESLQIPVDLLESSLEAIVAGLDRGPPNSERAAVQLVRFFGECEDGLLPYLPARSVMKLTGRVSAATTSRSALPQQNGVGHEKVVIGELLELALRSRQKAELPNAFSQEALITAILRSPVFPALFIHLSKLRRGDLVGSLLELLRLVPPLPAVANKRGAFAALSDSQATTWVGGTEDVISTDRLAIIQAAAQAKLRWHAACLYHRWGEDQLMKDNIAVFERLGLFIGGSLTFLTQSDPNAATTRIGVPLMIAQAALRQGSMLQSNSVINSATCTWNMVKLFATSIVSAQSAPTAGLPDSADRRDITEMEYARLIFSTSMALAGDTSTTRDKDATSYAAAAFALQDSKQALELLTSKVQRGRDPDIKDVGVMLAGIANADVELAVETFLGRLNNDSTATESASEILASLKPTPALYSMLISKAMFKARSDLVSRLLADADQRGLMSTTVLRSLDAILRQHISVRPTRLLELLNQLTQADEWTPDPRILAWFCRCAARGQSLQEAMQRAEMHASHGASTEQSSSEEIAEGAQVRTSDVGQLEDIRAAVGILSLSANKLGYVHGPTAVLLVKQLCNSAERQRYEDRDEYVGLLDSIAQAVFHARRVDLGAQQRSLEGTVWLPNAADATDAGGNLQDDGESAALHGSPSDDNGEALPGQDMVAHAQKRTVHRLPPLFGETLIQAYVRLRNRQGAVQAIQWLRQAAPGSLRLSKTTLDYFKFRATWHWETYLEPALKGKLEVRRTKVFWRRPSTSGTWRKSGRYPAGSSNR